MSNFICPKCRMTNIDCGKAGYKTDKEIKLEKKLDIAVKALEWFTSYNFIRNDFAKDALKKIKELN